MDEAHQPATLIVVSVTPSATARTTTTGKTNCRHPEVLIVVDRCHSGIGFMPPDTVHYERSTALTEKRAATLDIALAAHPSRFKGIAPRPPRLPLAVWINPPIKKKTPQSSHPIAPLNS